MRQIVLGCALLLCTALAADGAEDLRGGHANLEAAVPVPFISKRTQQADEADGDLEKDDATGDDKEFLENLVQALNAVRPQLESEDDSTAADVLDTLKQLQMLFEKGDNILGLPEDQTVSAADVDALVREIAGLVEFLRDPMSDFSPQGRDVWIDIDNRASTLAGKMKNRAVHTTAQNQQRGP